jgi:hypothetical protein
MAGVEIDIASLPEDIREKLAELDLELSEGKWWTESCYFLVIFIHNYPLSEPPQCPSSLLLGSPAVSYPTNKTFLWGQMHQLVFTSGEKQFYCKRLQELRIETNSQRVWN